MNFLHRIAHWIGMNACEVKSEWIAPDVLEVGYRCVTCGHYTPAWRKVSGIRFFARQTWHGLDWEQGL